MTATDRRRDGAATEALSGVDAASPGRAMRVILNRKAGSKGGLPTGAAPKDAVRGVLEAHGLEAEIVETGDEAEANAAVRDAVASGVEVVVAAGGDGTVRLVASALLGRPTTLGILPLGSIMNIARSLGIPRELDAAAAVIAAGQVRTIDVGEVAGRAFYEAGSVGLNAAIFREASHFDDPDWTSILRTVAVALRYRPARMALQLDDRIVRTRALMVTISNGPYTGAGMTVAPEARMDDGRFDVRVFRGFSKWELLRHLGSIAFGRRRYAPHVSTYRSKTVRVTSARPLPCRADNIDLGWTPVSFATRPAALRVIVPSEVGAG